MPVFVDNISFQDEFTGSYFGKGDSVGSPVLMGCVGDFMFVKINFHVSWNLTNFNATFQGNTITLNSGGAIIQSVGNKKNPNSIFSSFNTAMGGSFVQAGFQIGDTIVITNSGVNNGSYTIANLTDTTLTITSSFTTGSFAGCCMYGTTPINAFDFYYNIQGGKNTPDYNSLTDLNTLQKFSGLMNSEYGYNAMSPNSTSQAWFVSSVDGISCVPTIEYINTTGYNQNYVLFMPFLITPLFQSNQLSNIESAIEQALQGGTDGGAGLFNGQIFNPPDYFTNDCLNFVYQIDAKFSISNSIADQSSVNNVNFGTGNTSWFNSFFPTGINQSGNLITNVQYFCKSIQYTNASGGTLTSIDCNNPTNVIIEIGSVGVSSVEDMFVLNFMGLPVNQGATQGYQFINQETYRTVLLHDRCSKVISDGSTNGDMFGNPTQAITNVTSTRVSTSIIKISFTINLGYLSQETLANLVGFNAAYYAIWVTPQYHSVTTIKNSLRSAILCDVNTAFVNTDDATLLVIDTSNTTDIHFFDTETNEITDNATTDFKGFSGGYGIARCDFKVKSGCTIQSVSCGFVVEIYEPNDYYYLSEIVDSFPIEQWNKTTGSMFNKTINEISITEQRNFPLPANDLRNQRSIKRYTELDGDGFYGYEILYGFQLDYKWWIPIQTSQVFELFPASYWALFTQGYTSINTGTRAIADGYGCSIVYQIVWNILNNTTGITTQFIQKSNISVYDDGGNANGSTCVISTIDNEGNGLSETIPSDIPFIIEAVFNNPEGFNPDTVKIEIILFYNNGTQNIYDRITNLDNSSETSTSYLSYPLAYALTNSNETCTAIVNCDISESLIPLKNLNIFAKITS